MGGRTFKKVMREIAWVLSEKWVWLFVGLFSVAMLFVFWPVLPRWIVISSPDDAPFYRINYAVQQVEALLSGAVVFSPYRLLRLPAPVRLHEFVYVLAQCFFALSVAYSLRTQQVRRLAAYGAGLLGAFSGYIFTLFSAGHLGFFYLFSSVFWSFGLIHRGLATRRPHYFALLGVLVLWGQSWQPDIWVLMVGLIVAYTVWRLAILLRSGMRFRALIAPLLPCFLLAALIAFLVGFAGIRQVFDHHLAGRDQQIESSAQFLRQASSGEQEKQQEKQQEMERWLFATGWSLPPEDCVEFLVPGIFGNDSFRPPYPYWGRLGRPHDFEPGRMMPNYRQHTVYLGLVSVVLGLMGVLGWWGSRKTKNAAGSAASARTQGAASRSEYTDVPFWCVVWCISLVLAMGRYTPAYRLFYSIPYMDYLRAPVKFLHFTEVATAFLAGFGLDALLTGRISLRARRGLIVLVATGAGVLALSGMLLSLNGVQIERHIETLGVGPVAAALKDYSVYNCWRAAGLAVAVVVLLVGSLKKRSSATIQTVVAVCLITLGVADLALVARRYVIPIDVEPFHQENLVIREMRRRTNGRPANVANYATRNVWGQDWFNTALRVHGFPNQVPDVSDPQASERPFLLAFQENPVRFWDVMGVRFVILPSQTVAPFLQAGLLAPLRTFELGAGTVRDAAERSPNPLLLSEVRQGGLPQLHFAWSGGVELEHQVAQACRPDQRLPVTDAPSPAARSDRQPLPVAFEQVRGERGVWITKAVVDAPEPGLLVWNERYSPDLVAWIDGQSVPVRKVNGLWCGVEVPAGTHLVRSRVAYRPLWNGVSASVTLLVLLWGAVASMRQKKAADD